MYRWVFRISRWRWRWWRHPAALIWPQHFETSELSMRTSPPKTCRNRRSGTSPRWVTPRYVRKFNTATHSSDHLCVFSVSLQTWPIQPSAMLRPWDRLNKRPMSWGGKFKPRTATSILSRALYIHIPVVIIVQSRNHVLNVSYVSSSVKIKACLLWSDWSSQSVRPLRQTKP